MLSSSPSWTEFGGVVGFTIEKYPSSLDQGSGYPAASSSAGVASVMVSSVDLHLPSSKGIMPRLLVGDDPPEVFSFLVLELNENLLLKLELRLVGLDGAVTKELDFDLVKDKVEERLTVGSS